MFFLEIAIFVIMLIFFGMLGKKINHIVFGNNSYSIILGFLFYASMFHVLSFFPMINRASYNWIIYLVVPICLAISLKLAFTNNKFEKISPNLIVFFVCVTIIAVINAINPVTIGDQLFYAPMSLSSSFDGSIYSNTYVLSGYTTHYADSIYLLYNTILNAFPGSNSIEFIVVLQSFLLILIFSTFHLISEIIFKKYKYLVTYVQVVGFTLFFPIITVWSLPIINFSFINGTFLFLNITIPLLLIFNLFFTKIKNPTLFLAIVTLSGCAFSSSALFIFSIGLLVSLIYSFIFESKNIAKEKFRVIMNISIVVAIEIWAYTINLFLPLKYSYIILAGIITIYIFYKYKVRNINYKYAKNIIYFLAAIYLLVAISSLTFFIFKKPEIFEVEKIWLHNFPSLTNNLILSFLFIISLVVLYKDGHKQYLHYYFLCILFIANPIIRMSIGNVVGNAAFYRIYYLAGKQFIFLIFIVFVLIKFSKKFMTHKFWKSIKFNLVVIGIILMIYIFLVVPVENSYFNDDRLPVDGNDVVSKISSTPKVKYTLTANIKPKTCFILQENQIITSKKIYPYFYRPEINVIRAELFDSYAKYYHKEQCSRYFGITDKNANPSWVVNYGTHVQSTDEFEIYYFNSEEVDKIIENRLIFDVTK